MSASLGLEAPSESKMFEWIVSFVFIWQPIASLGEVSLFIIKDVITLQFPLPDDDF